MTHPVDTIQHLPCRSNPPSTLASPATEFGLSAAGPCPVLAFSGPPSSWPAGLFPEWLVQRAEQGADARLDFSPRTHRSLPCVVALPGFLRAPPVAGRPAVLHSATLSAMSDGRQSGWAERILPQDGWFTPAVARRAERCMDTLISNRLGGTFWGRTALRPTLGRAVVFAAADPALTRRMVEAAGPGAELVSSLRDPWSVIAGAASIHVAGDAEEGLVARLLGVPVQAHRPGPLLQTADTRRLFAAVLLLGTRYVDPFTGEPATCEAFLEHAVEWRRHSAAFAGVTCCVGVSFWKRRRIAEVLGAAGAPAFARTIRAALRVARRRGGGIAAWASRVPPGLKTEAAAAGVPVTLLEDGFVRSVGLGADFLPPMSVVLDATGLYYDPTGPSDLETILAQTAFTPELLHRAGLLRARIVRDRVTKYNLSGPDGAPKTPPGIRTILVPGQVADDRSVMLGGGGAGVGLDLLRRVRQRLPDAHILYKPHPDVEAGHRPGLVPEHDALAFADQVVRGDMAGLLDLVDEVHTLTSLAGFEALMRHKPVTTYGRPFYAGWGLTTDLDPLPGRTRRLSLDALVAGTLVLYPAYIDPVTGLPCGPETVLDRMAHAVARPASVLVRARRLQGRMLRQFSPRRAPSPAGASEGRL